MFTPTRHGFIRGVDKIANSVIFAIGPNKAWRCIKLLELLKQNQMIQHYENYLSNWKNIKYFRKHAKKCHLPKPEEHIIVQCVLIFEAEWNYWMPRRLYGPVSFCLLSQSE
ncbi:unnamed protein product [Rhizophagus irregularis]|nr:unnamed protein product [Rhizophagus irregularis]